VKVSLSPINIAESFVCLYYDYHGSILLLFLVVSFWYEMADEPWNWV